MTPTWRIVAADFTAAARRWGDLPAPVGPEIAFAGRSNVGKSSLMNALLGRKKLVRTSSTPGCTRDLAFFSARAADGIAFTLVDLPGYGYARRSKEERQVWAELVERYLDERATLHLVVLLIDARRGVEPEEREWIARLRKSHRAVVVVGTKIDKVPKSKRQALLQSLGAQTIGFSAVTAEGVEALWSAIRRQVIGSFPAAPRPSA